MFDIDSVINVMDNMMVDVIYSYVLCLLTLILTCNFVVLDRIVGKCS